MNPAPIAAFHKAFRDVFLKIYTQNKTKFLSSIRRRNLTDHDAEDVLSTASSAVWSDLEACSNSKVLFGVTFIAFQADCMAAKKEMELRLVKQFWVVVRNKTIDFLRKNTTAKARTQAALENFDQDCVDQFSIQIAGPAERRHARQILDDFLKKVPVEDLSILLYKQEGNTSAEIAELLGMNKNTVRTRYRRLMDKMKADIHDAKSKLDCNDSQWSGQ